MKNRNLIIYLLLFILGIIYLLFGDILHIYIFCPIYKITHLYCPGCGMTRALKSLITGNFYQAFRYNNLIFLLPFFIIYLLESILEENKIKNLNLKRFMQNKFWYSVLFIVIAFGVLRNIPYFSYLIPTKI